MKLRNIMTNTGRKITLYHQSHFRSRRKWKKEFFSVRCNRNEEEEARKKFPRVRNVRKIETTRVRDPRGLKDLRWVFVTPIQRPTSLAGISNLVLTWEKQSAEKIPVLNASCSLAKLSEIQICLPKYLFVAFINSKFAVTSLCKQQRKKNLSQNPFEILTYFSMG